MALGLAQSIESRVGLLDRRAVARMTLREALRTSKSPAAEQGLLDRKILGLMQVLGGSLARR
jgi:hypothetical protein